MADFQAFLVVTLLTWTAVSGSGITPELSTTTGDTVNIPCLLGEGTISYISWYYNSGTGHQKILERDKGDLTKAAEYANRASLQDDYSTLILKIITVADEGTYHCIVDTLKQPTVSNIETKLNVFSLRPDTLPVISPNCTLVDDSSSCIIHANQSFNLTCTLPSVYPVKYTELVWYQDGNNLSSIYDDTQNDDGTTNISRQMQISQTGNFTCNATYHSAKGKENTGMSVKAWIKPADATEKNMTAGQIAGIYIVLLVGIFITLFICRSKVKGQRSSTNTELSEVITEASELLNKPPENCSEDVNVTSTEERNRPGTSAGNGSTDRNEASKLTGILSEHDSNDENVESSDSIPSLTVRRRNVNRIVREEEFEKLSELIKPSYYKRVCNNLGISIVELGQIEKDGQHTSDALMTVFTRWRDKQPLRTNVRALLAEELERSDLGSLSGELLAGSLILEWTDFDDILVAVAKRIRKDSEIDTLGKKIGFAPEDIHGYIATNHRTQNITYAGTLQMLRDWRDGQTNSTERGALKTALEQSGQIRLADDLFP